MINRGNVVLGILALSVLAIALVSGHHPWDGPELLRVTGTHGVNLGDLLVVAAWVAGAGLCWRLWSSERQ